MTLREVKKIADKITDHFWLDYRSIEEFNYRWMGECDVDGNIKIRLKVYGSNRSLHRHTIIRTLCHEIAHLMFFNHGKMFRLLEKELITWAKQQEFWNC